MTRGLALGLICCLIAFAIMVASTTGHDPSYFPRSLLEKFACDWRSGGKSAEPVIDDFKVGWYTPIWQAAREESLALPPRDPDVSDRLRFTWLRSFHEPVIVRIDTLNDGRARLVANQLSGTSAIASPKYVERFLTPVEYARLRTMIESSGVLSLSPTSCEIGLDGARWILESSDGVEYRYVDRWSPEAGPVREAGLQMLALTGWTFKPIY